MPILPSPKKYTLPITRAPQSLETVSFVGQLIGWSDVDLRRPSGKYVQIFLTDRKICTHRFSWRTTAVQEDPIPRRVFDIPEHLIAKSIYQDDLVEEIAFHLRNPGAPPIRVVIERPYPMLRAHRLGSLIAEMTGAPCKYMNVMGWDVFDPLDIKGGVLHLQGVHHKGPLAIMSSLADAFREDAMPRIVVVPPQHWQAIRIFQQTVLEDESLMKVFVTDREYMPSPFRDPLDVDIRDHASMMASELPPSLNIKARTYTHSRYEDALASILDADGEMDAEGRLAWERAEANFPAIAGIWREGR